MAEDKDIQQRRFSLRQLSQRAEIEIYKYLPLHSHSQSAEFSFPNNQSSRKVSEPTDFIPQGPHLRKNEALSSYKSQLCIQIEKRSQEGVLDLLPKRFTINNLSLKQLEPMKLKGVSLPKIKKRSPELISIRKSQLEWITPEQMMARKLQMSRKPLPKLTKERYKVSLQKRVVKKVFNSLKCEISGWNSQEMVGNDFYD